MIRLPEEEAIRLSYAERLRTWEFFQGFKEQPLSLRSWLVGPYKTSLEMNINGKKEKYDFYNIRDEKFLIFNTNIEKPKDQALF